MGILILGMWWVDRLRLEWKKIRNERLYRRILIDIPVKVYQRGNSPPLLEKIGDWSPGGVFVLTGTLLPIGTMVDLEFSLGDATGSHLKLRGQVIRHQTGRSADNRAGIGIMFTDFTQSGLNVLREVLTRVYPEGRVSRASA